jgi:hypothetical protein
MLDLNHSLAIGERRAGRVSHSEATPALPLYLCDPFGKYPAKNDNACLNTSYAPLQGSLPCNSKNDQRCF